MSVGTKEKRPRTALGHPTVMGQGEEKDVTRDCEEVMDEVCGKTNEGGILDDT